jgi:hypothetical protein
VCCYPAVKLYSSLRLDMGRVKVFVRVRPASGEEVGEADSMKVDVDNKEVRSC